MKPQPRDELQREDEIARLRSYHERSEAMRKSILEWMNGEKPTKEGWMQPHGWKELRRALQNMEPMT